MTDMTHILEQATYKPGDPAPQGYLARQEWAAAQYKAGLRQRQCGRCGLWNYPQEMSAQFDKLQSSNSPMNLMMAVCNDCAD